MAGKLHETRRTSSRRALQPAGRTVGLGPWRSAVATALVWALAGPAPAQSCFIDWKLFDASSTLNPSLCFFDASGVTRTRGRDIGVWTKCIGWREIDAIAPTGPAGRAIAARTGQALLAGYVPPVASLDGLDRDGRMSVISYESAADLAGLKAQSATYYNVDCARGAVRAIRVTAEAASAVGFRGAPSALDSATPRGSGASLLQLLCGFNVVAPTALGQRTNVQKHVRWPTPLSHQALSAHQTRTQTTDFTQQHRNAPRRPLAPSRGASASLPVTTLRPRLS
jgi:hypothetical protein